MATAVVYYSATGNCAIAARALAEKLGARLVELKEKKARKMEKIGASFMAAGFQAMCGMRSRLVGQPWRDVADCAELHILTPIWASKPAPAFNTFLSRCDFAGKTVSLYTIQADPDDAAAPARAALADRIKQKGGTMAASHGLTGAAPGKPADEGLAQKILSLI